MNLSRLAGRHFPILLASGWLVSGCAGAPSAPVDAPAPDASQLSPVVDAPPDSGAGSDASSRPETDAADLQLLVEEPPGTSVRMVLDGSTLGWLETDRSPAEVNLSGLLPSEFRGPDTWTRLRSSDGDTRHLDLFHPSKNYGALDVLLRFQGAGNWSLALVRQIPPTASESARKLGRVPAVALPRPRVVEVITRPLEPAAQPANEGVRIVVPGTGARTVRAVDLEGLPPRSRPGARAGQGGEWRQLSAVLHWAGVPTPPAGGGGSIELRGADGEQWELSWADLSRTDVLLKRNRKGEFRLRQWTRPAGEEQRPSQLQQIRDLQEVRVLEAGPAR